MISRSGHHYFTFKALEAANTAFAKAAANFDAARSQRDEFSYDALIEVSDTDTEDLVEAVKLFQQHVEKWIASRYPPLASTDDV